MGKLNYRIPNTNDFREIYVKVTDTLPVGAICQYGGSTAPSGYLMCNGQAVSRTDYSDLFSAIGTSFGSGDGLTTFNLPNFNGRVPVGLDGTDTSFDTIGETGGSKYLQEHSHIFKINSSYGQASDTSGGYTGGTSGELSNLVSRVSDVTTGNAGNLQPYLVTNFIIKASKKVALDRGNVVDSLEGSDTDSAPSVRAVNNSLEDYQTKGEIIWTNPSPNAAFANQSIKFTDTYSYYDITFRQDGQIMKTQRCYVDANFNYNLETIYGGYIRMRDLRAYSNSLYFGNGFFYQTYGGTGTTNNNQCIPYQIIGYK